MAIRSTGADLPFTVEAGMTATTGSVIATTSAGEAMSGMTGAAEANGTAMMDAARCAATVDFMSAATVAEDFGAAKVSTVVGASVAAIDNR
jgi:hypothetical protein